MSERHMPNGTMTYWVDHAEKMRIANDVLEAAGKMTWASQASEDFFQVLSETCDDCLRESLLLFKLTLSEWIADIEGREDPQNSPGEVDHESA